MRNKKRAEAPRITMAECQALIEASRRFRLPLLKLHPDTGRQPPPVGSRIGGRPWAAAEDEEWPKSASGEPMIFAAQINFSEMPPLAQFPEAGLLQVFLPLKDGGLAYDGIERKHLVRWHETPMGESLLRQPEGMADASRAIFESDAAIKCGLALRPEAAEAEALFEHPDIEPLYPNTYDRLPADEAVAETLQRLEEIAEGLWFAQGEHWIGGHARFCQHDLRNNPVYAGLDRVLLHLGADDHVCIGDAGDINILIASEDLENKRFDSSVYTWDCH